MAKLARVLFDREIVSLEELASELWGKADRPEMEATTLLLRLAAAARPAPEEMPLVPHRLHFLARGPEGISCCLSPECRGAGARCAPDLPGKLRLHGEALFPPDPSCRQKGR